MRARSLRVRLARAEQAAPAAQGGIAHQLPDGRILWRGRIFDGLDALPQGQHGYLLIPVPLTEEAWIAQASAYRQAQEGHSSFEEARP